MSIQKKTVIAICYDFDGTLIRGNMQENSFIPELGQSKDDFWNDVKSHAEKNDMDEVLAYMQKMIEGAKSNDKEFTKTSITEHGELVDLFPGVEQWFQHIKNYAKESKVTIEHYIISSGLEEMIKGSKIGKEFKHIFASGFVYDANDVAIFPARSINYTTKVQYLFRINKGIKNSWDNSEINKFTPEKDRSIPFSQMIYIGDGDTDVPAMKMLNYKGGYSITVYPPKNGQRKTKAEINKEGNVKKLQSDNRCQFTAEANYEKDKYLYNLLTMLIDRIAKQHKFEMNLNAK